MSAPTNTPEKRTRPWQVVRDHLSQGLADQWQPGARLPSLRELADRFGAAPGTVHRAVQDLAAEGLLVAKPRHGFFVARRSTDAESDSPTVNRDVARHHDTVMSNVVIDVYYHDYSSAPFRDQFVPTMAEAFDRFVSSRGSVVRRHPISATEGVQAIDTCQSDADAVVVFNHGSYSPIRWNSRQAAIIVNTAAEANLMQATGYDWLSIDQELGGQLAGLALRACDVSRVCFLGVGTNQDNPRGPYRLTSEQRLTGFLRGWGDDATVDRLYSRSYAMLAGSRAVMQYLKLDPRPTGIFAASDEIAVGFVSGAMAHGLCPGVDYQIIGFDGQQRAREMEMGPLTTIEVPAEVMGQQAGELLRSRLAQPGLPTRRVLVGCSLLRGSTARVSDTSSPTFQGAQ